MNDQETQPLRITVELCKDHHNSEYVYDWSWKAQIHGAELGYLSMESETEFPTRERAKGDFRSKMKTVVSCVTGKPWPAHARLYNIEFVDI